MTVPQEARYRQYTNAELESIVQEDKEKLLLLERRLLHEKSPAVEFLKRELDSRLKAIRDEYRSATPETFPVLRGQEDEVLVQIGMWDNLLQRKKSLDREMEICTTLLLDRAKSQ